MSRPCWACDIIRMRTERMELRLCYGRGIGMVRCASCSKMSGDCGRKIVYALAPEVLR